MTVHFENMFVVILDRDKTYTNMPRLNSTDVTELTLFYIRNMIFNIKT